MDEPERVRRRGADSHDQRGRRGPADLRAQGRARCREPGAGGSDRALHRRSPAARRRGPPCPLREQDHLLRAGHVAACGWRRPSITTRSIRARSPRSGAPAASSARRCSGISARRSAAIRTSATCSSMSRSGTRSASQTFRAAGGSSCRPRSASAFRWRASRFARLLRRLSKRPAAREPHSGPARFLRRAHLSPHRPRRRLSYRLDPGDRRALMTKALQIRPDGALDFLVARRTHPPSRPRRHPVSEGAFVCHPRERRRVQHRRQPRRLLRHAHRDRLRDGRLSDRRAHRRARARRWASSPSTSASRTTGRAARTWRPSTAIRATACAARWSSTTAPTRPRRS